MSLAKRLRTGQNKKNKKKGLCTVVHNGVWELHTRKREPLWSFAAVSEQPCRKVGTVFKKSMFKVHPSTHLFV